MKRITYNAATLLVCGLMFSSASAQQKAWSLRKCIDYAIEHNVNIKQTANTAEQSAVEVNTARWA